MNNSTNPLRLNVAKSIFRRDLNILCASNLICEHRKYFIIKLVSLNVCRIRLGISRCIVNMCMNDTDYLPLVTFIRLQMSIGFIHHTNNKQLTKYASRLIFEYVPIEFSMLMMLCNSDCGLFLSTRSHHTWLRYVLSIF